MAKKSGEDSRQIDPAQIHPAPTTVKFSVPRKAYQKVEAVRNWERRSESSDLVLSGRPQMPR